jgi:hypothetical protein
MFYTKVCPPAASASWRLGALFAAVALAACGGGSDSTSTTTATVAPSPAAGALVVSDARNGSYTAYTTGGERYTLTMNFDTQQYTLNSQVAAQTVAASGRFRADTVAGTFVFQPTGEAEGLTAKFRVTDDLVVGSYKFNDGILPFVAARKFATTAAEAARTYNNFGINRVSGVNDSRIYASRINANNTMEICNDNVVYAMDKCPAASILNYTLTLNTDLFTATRTGETLTFRVARAGSENLYLYGAINANGDRFFRIGTVETTAFPSGTARGGSTSGEWGTATFSQTAYSSTGTSATGSNINLTGTLSTIGTLGPTGMRGFTSGNNGFVMQNTQLAILLGARNSTSAGYMQLGSK